MDEIDRAQASEERDREEALAHVRARIAASRTPRDPRAALDCIDCAQPIDAERLRALRHCTSRCVACATDFEQRMRKNL